MNVKTLLLSVSVLLLAVGTAVAELPGEKLFNQKCAMCHVVKGKGGTIGPDLSKVGARMNDTQLRAKVMYPKKSNPSSTMPSFQTLPKPELDAVVGYLKTLR